MRRQLEKLYGEDSSGAETGDGRTASVLRQAADLITMPVKPAVRAAAYRVIADLPGVRAGRVTDPLGVRASVSRSPARRGPRWGVCNSGWSWNLSTCAMLCEQSVLVEPSPRAREAGLDAGTTVNYEATTRMSWGEHQITVPKNAGH